MENGVLLLKEDEEDTIRDLCKRFITSDAAKEFYNKHKEFSAGLTDFSNYIKENTSINYIHIWELIHIFFSLLPMILNNLYFF